MISRMKSFTRLAVLMVLCCVLVAGNLIVPGKVVSAATKKATISTTEMTIPIGKISNKASWNDNSWYLKNGEKLTVKNSIKGATYQFTSSNTKVVKIDKTGGYLTGIKSGSATITCVQTYKNKKNTVGKCKVTVKNATLTTSEYENEFAVGKGEFNLDSYYSSSEPLYQITYRNPDASYSLTSDSKDFTIKEVKYDASKVKDITDSEEYQTVLKDFIADRYLYGYQFNAEKAGVYTITIKETYNKKTKTLGSFKVEIKDTTIREPKVELLEGNSLNVFDLVSYTKENTVYYFAIKDYDETNDDNNVVYLERRDNELYLFGNKTGTAEVIVTEGSEQGPVIGTVTITVIQAPCESIYVDSNEYTTYVGDEYFNIYYELEPWDTTDKVTIESDKPDVLKVEYNQEEGYWVYTPLKAGKVTITIKCGEQTVKCSVIVEE